MGLILMEWTFLIFIVWVHCRFQWQKSSFIAWLLFSCSSIRFCGTFFSWKILRSNLLNLWQKLLMIDLVMMLLWLCDEGEMKDSIWLFDNSGNGYKHLVWIDSFWNYWNYSPFSILHKFCFTFQKDGILIFSEHFQTFPV